MTEECKKCNRRLKLLSKKGTCAYCDYLNWIKDNYSYPNK